MTEGAFSSAPAQPQRQPWSPPAPTSRLILGLGARSPQWHRRALQRCCPLACGDSFIAESQPFLNIAAPGTDAAHTQKDQADRQSHETLFSKGSVASLGKRPPSGIPPQLPRPPPAKRSRMRKGSEEALTWPARPTPGGDRDAAGRGQGWGDPVLGASEVGGGGRGRGSERLCVGPVLKCKRPLGSRGSRRSPLPRDPAAGGG